MTKYRKYFDMMLAQNKKFFTDFKIIHDNFAKDPKTFKDEFNVQGREIQDIIQRFENRLCGHSESSGYSKFSANLAEKFQQEIKKDFPKIDLIGME